MIKHDPVYGQASTYLATQEVPWGVGGTTIKEPPSCGLAETEPELEWPELERYSMMPVLQSTY